MKANNKAMLRDDEEALSPVIAVILMVALTVVLAATVFVLAGDLGQDVGQSGPNMGLATSQATDSEWQVRITSLSSATQLDQFTCILESPGGGTQSAPCDSASWVSHTATGGADTLSVGDRLNITEDFSTTGKYTLELVHDPTGTSSASLSRQV